MQYILKIGEGFVFESESPAGFLKLWPHGGRTKYEDDSIKCRRDWALRLKHWRGKEFRYHNDAALVSDLFKYGLLEIITHRANWELKRLQKLKDRKGFYNIRINLDEINQKCEHYQAWYSNQTKAREKDYGGFSAALPRSYHTSIYAALREIFGVQSAADFGSDLDLDFLDNSIQGFCKENECEVHFTHKYFKDPERWAKEVLLHLIEHRIVYPTVKKALK